MTEYRSYNYNSSSPFGGIITLLLFILIFAGLFYVAKGVFYILTAVAPILFIITLFLDYKVILNYGKYLIDTLKQKPLTGLVMMVFTFFGFPLVAAYLFLKALLNRKINSMAQQYGDNATQGGYIEYEEVKNENELEDFLELPDKLPSESRNQSSDYDQLFK